MTHAGSIVRLEYFRNTEGKNIGGIRYNEVAGLLEDMKDFDCVSLYHSNTVNMLTDNSDRLYPTMVGFVSADFWQMYTFEYLYGQPFSKEDCINRNPVAIIMENTARDCFTTSNVIGKKITFQGNEFKIAGVVKNISLLLSPTDICTVWTPYVFNKFIPSGTYTYAVDILMPPSVPQNISKEKISRGVQHYFDKKNVKADFPPEKISTLKEKQKSRSMFQYGGMAALFLFLLIPAINILLLSITSTNSRAEEIAIRKTFGANRMSSFFRIMSENFLLTTTGALLGLALAIPVMKIVQQNIMQGAFTENLLLISHIDYAVIFAGVLPAVVVFSLLSGGLPAYLIAKCNIAQTLKGGSK
jgi:ABC-type antimicrobial peptide transport system permease subunit